jgi:hypothetical protein
VSFLFAFLLALGFFDSVVCTGDFFSIGVEGLGAGPRAAGFLAAFIAFDACAACSFCLSLASFFWTSCSHFSSRRIFFLKFFSFTIVCPRRLRRCCSSERLTVKTRQFQATGISALTTTAARFQHQWKLVDLDGHVLLASVDR